MSNPEICQNLRADGVCTKAPRPQWAIAVGNRVLLNLTPKVPSQAKLIDTAYDGQRYFCAGAQGREASRIAKQQSCNNYQPRG